MGINIYRGYNAIVMDAQDIVPCNTGGHVIAIYATMIGIFSIYHESGVYIALNIALHIFKNRREIA